MADKTLEDVAKIMKEIDFAMLSTKTTGGAIASRPMSNNKDVEYDGDAYFFTTEDSGMVADIELDPKVTLTYAGSKGFLGKMPLFVAVEGEAELIRDREAFEKHWQDGLERWFKEGTSTPGLVMMKVHAERIAYWDGDDHGEIMLPWTTANMMENSRTMLGAQAGLSDI